MNTKAKIYIYSIENIIDGIPNGLDVRLYTKYEDAKAKLLSELESNKRIENCREEYCYDKDVDIHEQPPLSGSWIFDSPIMYVRTVSENRMIYSRTIRSIFEKDLN